MVETFLQFEAFRQALTQIWQEIWILRSLESLEMNEFEA